MRKTVAILLSFYIVWEVLFLLIPQKDPITGLYPTFWVVAYYFNQSILIFWLLWILRGYFDTFFIDIVNGLNIVKLVYNTVFAIDRNYAESINNSIWIGLLIVVILILVLINKWIKT